MNNKYMIDKLISASYWLGRVQEAFDGDDIDGTISCMAFFRIANNCLLRSKSEDFKEHINTLNKSYDDLYNEYLEIRNGTIV